VSGQEIDEEGRDVEGPAAGAGLGLLDVSDAAWDLLERRVYAIYEPVSVSDAELSEVPESVTPSCHNRIVLEGRHE
jgi:hypothetical protein